jgi:glutamate-ammonia-ligase adenylyltransferase
VTDLASRIQTALAGTPLADPLPATAAAFADARGRDPAASRVEGPALRGLARAIASQPEVAVFLSHRSHFLERVAGLRPGALEARAARFPRDAEAILALDLEAALDALRIRRREEQAFAACADLGGLAPFGATSSFLSLLAESTLEIALALAHRELRPDVHDEFSVIGMGKLAGRELTYHSDLDLIFLFRGGAERIAQASRIGQRLISYLTTMTGAGVAYPVDTRLRPSGGQGMLVTSFDAFLRYQLEDAETWEHLALLRARAVAGSRSAADILARVHAHLLSLGLRAWEELAVLRGRVRAERADEAKGAIALKTGDGGLMDVDFLAGGGLLERGARSFPAAPSVPAMLRACAAGPRVEALLADYGLLRVVEARTRWVRGRGVEAFVPDAGAEVIAELVLPGLASAELVARLEAARERIHGAWEAVVSENTLAALER